MTDQNVGLRSRKSHNINPVFEGDQLTTKDDANVFYTPDNSPDKEFNPTYPEPLNNLLNTGDNMKLSPESKRSSSRSSVHDWQEEKASQNGFFDDGTMTYFW